MYINTILQLQRSVTKKRNPFKVEIKPNVYHYFLSIAMSVSNGQNEVEDVSSFSRPLSPQEEALQSLCKHLLKSRIFRGFYVERRYVDSLNKYRDIISLQRSEKEFEKLLMDIRKRLELFYTHSTIPNMWIGLTHGPLLNVNLPTGALELYLWVEMDELAFGQYWFSIKSIRFRQNEIILKLKVVREVEDESSLMTPMRTKKRATTETLDPTRTTATSHLPTTETPLETKKGSTTTHMKTAHQIETVTVEQQQIEWKDFVEILQGWGTSIKQSLYEFMAKDINKDNLKSLIRLFGLLLLSAISGTVVFIKYLGIFTLRFIYEFSRLTHVLTPIILKIIDVLSKIVGGFYILIAMIWRDTFGKRFAEPAEERIYFRQVEYNRPLYRAIQYDVSQQNQKKH